ncbi:MAG: hypothetical protein IPK53_16150 [bacterium]|nr:hypothetical protein [bacterium]
MALRPEIRLADVPALGLAVAGLGGVALALFAGGVVGLPLTVGVSVAAVLCLLFASSRRLAALMVYVVFAVVVGQRGSSELARTERASLLTFSNDTAIVVCRGTVVWYDEPMASGRSVNFWLADVQLRSDSQSVDLPDITCAIERSNHRSNDHQHWRCCRGLRPCGEPERSGEFVLRSVLVAARATGRSRQVS